MIKNTDASRRLSIPTPYCKGSWTISTEGGQRSCKNRQLGKWRICAFRAQLDGINLKVSRVRNEQIFSEDYVLKSCGLAIVTGSFFSWIK